MKEKKHYAGIDIGSNAARLLIKCKDKEHDSCGNLSKVFLLRVPLRLGEDAFTKGYIGKKKSKRLFHLMQAYKHLMELYEVEAYRACATSAMRDASNGAELVDYIQNNIGINIEIISGQEEAQLTSINLISNSSLDPAEVFLYVDVGGGSTELNLLHRGKLISAKSFDIGTIRQLSGKVSPLQMEQFTTYLKDIRSSYKQIQVVGSGGNINKLLRLGTPKDSATPHYLSQDKLRSIYDELCRYDTEERMRRFDLKADRADVIIPAAEIFLLVGDTLQTEGVIVPTKGLSDGLIESLCLDNS